MQPYFPPADMYFLQDHNLFELLDKSNSHLRVKLLIDCFVGDQHARADRATYVHVWMERVRMAKNPHQLWLYI